MSTATTVGPLLRSGMICTQTETIDYPYQLAGDARKCNGEDTGMPTVETSLNISILARASACKRRSV
jgi:hypothetical protein